MSKHQSATAAKIMIVEDDDDLRDELSELLRSDGFEVSAAKHGREALELLRSDLTVRAIVLDVAMPVMNGATFRGEQLRDPQLAGIPVILLTGRQDMGTLARTLGVQQAIAKPCADSLLQALGAYR
jgi:CheY-like chemotaxis protein